MSRAFKNSRESKSVFIISIGVFVFWTFGQFTNVYRFAITGAIFELLSLPMVSLLIILPIASIILLVKERVNIRSLNLYSMIAIAITVLMIVFRKSIQAV